MFFVQQSKAFLARLGHSPARFDDYSDESQNGSLAKWVILRSFSKILSKLLWFDKNRPRFREINC